MPSVRSVVSTFVTGAVLIVGGGAAYSAVTAGPASDRATVVRVIDGDTIEVRYDRTEHTVRLLNIDTPETKHPGKAVECLGPEATRYLQDQLMPGDVVRLEYDVERYDRYDRERAGVFEGDVLVNAEIARRGLGIPVLFEPNRRFLEEVTAAYEEGKAAQAGMFSPTLACTFEARIQGYADSVASVEAAASATDPAVARQAADAVVAEGATLIALIGGAEAGSLAAAGLGVAELDVLRVQVVDLQGRAEAAAKAAVAEAERLKAEEAAKKKAEEARKKAEEEAKRKAEEARKKAEEEAKRKAEEEARQAAEAEAARVAEEQARQAAEAEAQRQAEQAAAEAEAVRRAQEQQSQIQPFVPQQPAPAPAPAPVNVYYQNCDAARAAGAAPVYVGQPGYGTHLDRDSDGVGCE
ncbi:excalibur calcium-binding domain-containing protein [Ornithinimicrobium cerasi]|uniref:Micrococcal nuclease n=1 Tax=Ornithinimicrobium cerasi TaxID=2248773 RepID=A0A285VE42_9MICO|nr:excalibur calcium-binding domain-containing protein [Ornithinimicrobium cerasi]SOC52354.1 micrococcal nuclease [Ornithinimicrobium cerasi]